MIADSAGNVDGWEKVLSAAIAKAALPETGQAAIAVAKRNTERARRDALVAIARDIPDPADFARYLPLEIVELLRRECFQHGGVYQCTRAAASVLRPYSLVEYGGRFLTAFGMSVRREIMADDE